jgi:thiamine-phosphate pyrophosphorylase
MLPMTGANTRGIRRIIDANCNRTMEGLRVCEEVCRFILNDAALTRRLKSARHLVREAAASLGNRKELLESRASDSDVGTKITHALETRRDDYRDIFFANIQRVKESVRVLEEFSKLTAAVTAGRFKKIRYAVYDIEKSFAQKIRSLRHTR